MRHLISLAAAGMLTAGVATAQDVPANPNIENVIQSQIDAFLADDVATAFAFASPSIQRMFNDAQRFGTMVETGYPMVWRPAQVDFIDLSYRCGELWQQVMIRDQAGAIHMLGYQMDEVDGAWRIDGVQILRAPEAGA